MSDSHLDAFDTRDLSDQSLPSWVYKDPGFFELERDRVFRSAWHLVCHISDIPDAGDYATYKIYGESVFALRGKDGDIRAFHNVCRHRAARLVDGDQGNCGGRVTCPYHAWTYGHDGGLIGIPQRSEYDFDPDAFGLVPVEMEICLGFVFIRFETGSASVRDMLAPVWDELVPYRFESLKPLGRVTLRPRAVNWKHVSDNYVDALHIAPAHPGLTSLVGDSYGMESKGDVQKLWGKMVGIRNAWPSVRAYLKYLPDVDHLPKDNQRLWLYIKLWPNLAFDIYPDQIDFMQFIPVSPSQTLIREISYGQPDDRRDMRAARYLNWRINRQVNAEDTQLIERVEEGMGSSSFSMSPLGRNEVCLRAFAARMRSVLPICRLPEPPCPDDLHREARRKP